MRHLRGNGAPLVINVNTIGLLCPNPASMYTVCERRNKRVCWILHSLSNSFIYCVRHEMFRIWSVQDFRQTLKIDQYCKRDSVALGQLLKNAPNRFVIGKCLDAISWPSIDNCPYPQMRSDDLDSRNRCRFPLRFRHTMPWLQWNILLFWQKNRAALHWVLTHATDAIAFGAWTAHDTSFRKAFIFGYTVSIFTAGSHT